MTEFGHQAPLGRSYLVKIVCLGLALAVTTHALAQDELQSLSPEYRKWLEEEVVYIITDREREVFLSLESVEERQRMIEAFWKRRDPNRASPGNEFKEEHYRRLEYANTTFSKHTSRPGWKTEQGRMYIILGKPLERHLFDTYRDLAHCELWYYAGDHTKGLPSFFYLLFFKRHDVGEYRLYSPQADGPLSLIRGKQDTTDSRAALDRLLEISTDLAHASRDLHRLGPCLSLVRPHGSPRLHFWKPLARSRHAHGTDR